MPELPEVETTVKQLIPHLPTRRVVTARLRFRNLYRTGSLGVRSLLGRRVETVERIGKNILVRFHPPAVMVVNLGMTGQLLTCGRGERPPGFNAKHLHCRFELDDGSELRYYDPRRFGHIFIAESCDFQKDLNIGPDPFQATPAELRKKLHGRTAAIKPLLMDQRIIAGLGNIYTDETLFYAGIDPRTPGGKAELQAGRILACARRVLRRAIEHGGSTILSYRKRDGSHGEFQRFHAVYGRRDQRCVACDSRIVKIVLSGRATHFCPECQR
ncbi:MAG: bifunctional DNA-formamidopyrimidine glycosylase/DNA-(apurinic or apyrimidinic site) lyase [Candidatus Latescibacterota bacterium]